MPQSRLIPLNAYKACHRLTKIVRCGCGGSVSGDRRSCLRRCRRETAPDVFRGARAEHQRFDQRIRRETVCAMQTGAGAFAHAPQSRKRRAPSMITRYATHVIVRCRGDRNWLRRRIDTGVAACGIDGRKSRRKTVAESLAAIEVNAATQHDLAMYGAGHHVAWRELAPRLYP